jgi:hypothetical protein
MVICAVTLFEYRCEKSVVKRLWIVDEIRLKKMSVYKGLY